MNAGLIVTNKQSVKSTLNESDHGYTQEVLTFERRTYSTVAPLKYAKADRRSLARYYRLIVCEITYNMSSWTVNPITLYYTTSFRLSVNSIKTLKEAVCMS